MLFLNLTNFNSNFNFKISNFNFNSKFLNCCSGRRLRCYEIRGCKSCSDRVSICRQGMYSFVIRIMRIQLFIF